jgi:hypothetical protein
MYIAFVDDSGSDDRSTFQVAGAVFGKEEVFYDLELTLGVLVIESLIPEDQLQFFEEFKASDLYTGNNAFRGIKPADKRYEVIKRFLELVGRSKLQIAYGAVPKRKLLGSVYGSAEPIDVAFRACLPGIQTWMKENANNERCLLITDDYSNGKIKNGIRAAFRQLRSRFRPIEYSLGMLEHFHDAIAFCDSRDSIGVQVADMCSYFIGPHLQNDPESQWCYDLFKSRICHRGAASAANMVEDAETHTTIEMPNPLL